MTSWRYAASTDVGLVRDANEDSLHVDDHFAVVADGMGGHAAGEVASALAVAELRRGYEMDPTTDGLVRAIDEANRAIMADATDHPERSGMGTTAVLLALANTPGGSLPVIVNIGDSRAYQLRDGALRQITADHSVAEEWVRQGRLTPDEAAIHPRRHQLTRTLGVENDVVPDVFAVGVEPGDRILLCSDGLSNELSDSEIADLASSPHSLDEAVAKLVELANHRGGRDNITVVIVEFIDVTGALGDSSFTSAVPAVSSLENVPVALPVAPRGSERKARRKRFSWRTIVFVTALGILMGATVVVFGWYANSSYYLAASPASPATPKGVILIYQGQPGGFLWFKPKLLVNTGYSVSNLRLSDQALIAGVITEPTLDAAVHQAYFFYRNGKIVIPVTTTTTTTFPGSVG